MVKLMTITNTWMILTIALWLFVALQGLLLWGVLRQLGLLHKRIDALKQVGAPTPTELTIGQLAPAWNLPLMTGGALSTQALRGKAALIAFVHPSCAPCKKLLPQLNQLGSQLDPALAQIVLISMADAPSSAKMASEHAVTLPLLCDESGDIGDAYHAEYTPYLVAVDAEGMVRGRRATSSAAQVEAMLTAAVGHDRWQRHGALVESGTMRSPQMAAAG